jgi:predicted Zn-dependent peptidase
VILSIDNSIPSVAVNLCYHVGSKDETPGKRGFAHLFEHLMFEGSKNIAPGDYDRFSLQAGCENNAYTTDDKTNYYIIAPSHQLELALWLESDRMLGFTITEESLEIQKEVVLEEKRQMFDNRPYGSVALEFPPKLYNGSGYAWDTIGVSEDIASADLGAIKEFYEEYYVPNNAVLTIVGDIETTGTFEAVNRYFGSVPAGKMIKRKPFIENFIEKESCTEITDDVQLPGIFIAYKITRENSEEFYRFDILSDILCTGESSRFYHDLVYKKQLVSDIGCWVDAKEFSGIFYIYAILMPGVNIQQVQNEIDKIIEDVSYKGINLKELEKVKNRIDTRNVYRLQTNLSRADILSHYKTFYNDASLVNKLNENYRNVTAENIMQSAAGYLKPHKRVVLNYLPKSHQT